MFFLSFSHSGLETAGCFLYLREDVAYIFRFGGIYAKSIVYTDVVRQLKTETKWQYINII
jgi:hypothetical protein